MENIKNLREKAGLSQEALSQHIGVTQGAISQWEQGITFPSNKMLRKLARILNCTIDDLFDTTKENNKEVG